MYMGYVLYFTGHPFIRMFLLSRCRLNGFKCRYNQKFTKNFLYYESVGSRYNGEMRQLVNHKNDYNNEKALIQQVSLLNYRILFCLKIAKIVIQVTSSELARPPVNPKSILI